MQIGKLDRQITLSDYTESQNDYGEKTKSYTTTATVWAGVRYGSGNERMMANKNTVVGDVIFTIRFRSGLTEKTRITFEGVNYDIQHIAYPGRRSYIDITAKKVQ